MWFYKAPSETKLICKKVWWKTARETVSPTNFFFFNLQNKNSPFAVKFLYKKLTFNVLGFWPLDSTSFVVLLEFVIGITWPVSQRHFKFKARITHGNSKIQWYNWSNLFVSMVLGLSSVQIWTVFRYATGYQFFTNIGLHVTTQHNLQPQNTICQVSDLFRKNLAFKKLKFVGVQIKHSRDG